MSDVKDRIGPYGSVYQPAFHVASPASHSESSVQVRILKPCEGIVEGHSLGLLVPGQMYDLPEGLAQYLVSCKCAEVITVHGAAPPAPTDAARPPPLQCP